MQHRPLKTARLILASASPRRAMLLKQLGLDFAIDVSSSPEHMVPHLTPGELVESLSHEKAAEVSLRHPDADLVIGADTIVVLGGERLGKPADRAEAQRMLRSLAGNWHEVFTGYTVIAPTDGRTVSGHTVSEVRIRSLTDTEIDHYIDTGEPMDKAGAYAIQEIGTLLVAEIRGCYTNIVGLPLPSVDAAWRELGWSLL